MYSPEDQRMLSYLRLLPERLEEACRLIAQEFTPGWLTALSDRYKKGSVRSLTGFHPIYHGLLAGVLNQDTLTVVELATYLQYLRHGIPNANLKLPSLVQGLKNDESFFQYLFQLMITARFRLVVPNLRMEPILRGKQPDVVFRYLGTEFVVEATRPDLPERTKKLKEFLERLFFHLDKSYGADEEGLNVHLVVKTVDIVRHEKDLRNAIRDAKARPGDDYSTDDFVVKCYTYAGTFDAFESVHGPLTAQGARMAFATARTTTRPEPPNVPSSALRCKTTLVADLSNVEQHLYQDVSDKIDSVIEQKVHQLKPLWDHRREMYVFIDVGNIASYQRIDLERLVPRLTANVFSRYPLLLGGVVLAKRIWDPALRRYRLIWKPVFAPGQRRVENFFVFHGLERVEELNDFIHGVVGWTDFDNAKCPCASGKIFTECCKGPPRSRKGFAR